MLYVCKPEIRGGGVMGGLRGTDKQKVDGGTGGSDGRDVYWVGACQAFMDISVGLLNVLYNLKGKKSNTIMHINNKRKVL